MENNRKLLNQYNTDLNQINKNPNAQLQKVAYEKDVNYKILADRKKQGYLLTEQQVAEMEAIEQSMKSAVDEQIRNLKELIGTTGKTVEQQTKEVEKLQANLKQNVFKTAKETFSLMPYCLGSKSTN